MNDKTKVRLGIGLAGFLSFAGSLVLIAKSDDAGMAEASDQPRDEFRHPFQNPFEDHSYPPFLEEDEEPFSSQIRQPGVRRPQARSHAS